MEGRPRRAAFVLDLTRKSNGREGPRPSARRPAPRLTASGAMLRVRRRRASPPRISRAREQQSMTDTRKLQPLLQRVAAALDRLAPPPPPALDLALADAFVPHPARGWRPPVPAANPPRLPLPPRRHPVPH